MAERPETLAETRAQLRPSTFAIGAVFVGLFVALAIGDHYVGLHGSLGVRLALWGAVGLAVLALCVGLVQQRKQAADIADRSAELEQLSGELYRANRAKGEFLANVSHELRTPPGGHLGEIQHLLDQCLQMIRRRLNPLDWPNLARRELTVGAVAQEIHKPNDRRERGA